MDISIDIETLSLTNRATIISIGACVFDIKTSKVKNSFYVNLEHSDPQLAIKFDVSKDTVEWWSKQSDQAKLTLETDKVQADKAVLQFVQWVEQMSSRYKGHTDTRIWANDPQFDLSNISYTIDVYGYKTPWKYWEERSFRTIVDLAETITSISKDGFRVPPLVAHDALADAIAQAGTISKAFNLLRGK